MIKELSEIRRLRRVGKIHLGVKATSAKGTEYPKAVDYFVVKADESTPQAAADAFKAIYGPAPKELEIMFPVNSVNIFWDYWYKSYVRTATTGGKLICKGNGESASRLNVDNGELEDIPCPGPQDCPFALDKYNNPTACRRVGTLQFLLPKVDILGVWQIDTGSFNGVVALNSDIDMILAITRGHIAMIPLVLKIVPKKTTADGKQKIIHHLTVEWRGTMDKLIAFTDKQARIGTAYQLEAPNPDEIPTDLMPKDRVPELKHDIPGTGSEPAAAPKAPARPAAAALPPPAKQEAAPAGRVIDAEAESGDMGHCAAAEDAPAEVAFTQHEIIAMADKGISTEVGKAMRAQFKTSIEFMRHLTTLPGRKPAAAPAAKPAPAVATPPPPPPPANLDPQIDAEFARLKWPETKVSAMRRYYPDKERLLKMLKGAKI